jgi:hypothetical protein
MRRKMMRSLQPNVTNLEQLRTLESEHKPES